MLLALLLHVVVATPPLQVPADTIGIGHPSLRNVILRTGTDTSQVFMVQNGERRLVSTDIVTTTATSTGYLVAMQNIAPRGTFLDSIWVDRGTFATRRHVEVGTNAFKRLSFDGAHITGTIKDSTGEHTVDKHLERLALDNSVIGLLANALPLTAGQTVTFGSYDIGGHYQYMTMRVLGPEPIAHGGTSINAVKVAMEFSGRANWTVMRWVDPVRKKELQWSMTFGGREMIAVSK